MISKWVHLKEEALALRGQGQSIKQIRKELGIPLSTLSGWLRSVVLTDSQRAKLDKQWRQALVKARVEAVRWHNAQKNERVAEAAQAAATTLAKIDADAGSLELALAILYLGEGGKTNDTLTLGNSDPLIVCFYVSALERLYDIPRQNLRVELHLRADQEEQALKTFWSQATGIPMKRFLYTTWDERTRGRPTYPSYHGVCIISGRGVAIQRKLMYLARGFAEQIANYKRG